MSPPTNTGHSRGGHSRGGHSRGGHPRGGHPRGGRGPGAGRRLALLTAALLAALTGLLAPAAAAAPCGSVVVAPLVDHRGEQACPSKEITRAGVSPEAVVVLEQRNMAKYGNPLGPTADQLRAKYGSWQRVIDASTRTSAAVDHELGLEYRPCSY